VTPNRILAVSLVSLLAPLARAEALRESEVPAPLRSWVPWVLHDADDRACPYLSGSNAAKPCVWPGRARLELTRSGGRFSLRVEAYRPARMPLPGDAQLWPQELQVDGKAAPAVARDGLPSVDLSAGSHVLSGRFFWDAMPETLRLPPAIGLVELVVNGAAVQAPRIDEQGRLWLQAGADSAATGARLEVRVERLLVDEIPFQVTSRFSLIASGKNQEVLLPGALLAGFVPLALTSPLPARIEPSGKLRVQVRPGRWELYVTARRPGAVEELELPKFEDAAQEEIWAFAPQNRLRVVNIEGGTPVDAQQTQLPEDWKRYPAYRLRPGEQLHLTEVKRGDPQPAPDALQLARTLWLDFDGAGYSVQDRITGTLSRSWRLEMAAPVVLGRVAVDGQDQFITRMADAAGVEVRHGRADIVADSRIDTPARGLSATGWSSDFDSLSMQLNLPPGWRLLTASGVDQVHGSWLSHWNNLLDFFIVLVIALGCGKLWGWRWGLVALAALALSYHEPGAPRSAWIVALAAVALARLVTTGRIGTALQLVRRAALLVLLLLLIPFFVQQVRQTLYPVLEQPYRVAGIQGFELARNAPLPAPAPAAAPPAAPAEEPEGKVEEAEVDARLRSLEDRPAREAGVASSTLGGSAPRYNLYAEKSAALDRIDPKAMIQTGPGLPGWGWRSYRLAWSGPVQHAQQIRLWVISPAVNALLTVARLVLLALLFLCVAGLARADLLRRLFRIPGRGSALLLVSILTLALAAPDGARAEATPNPAVLQELKQKLLLPPKCLPNCAELARLHVSVVDDVLRLRIEVHAAEHVAIPLPAAARQWLPREVLIDGKASVALQRDQQGTLWAAVPRGVHTVLLQGRLNGLDAVQLALPLKPRRVEAATSGWRLDGVRENGVAESNLQLTRRQRSVNNDRTGENLPPFLRVERTLVLGLQWRVYTRVSRLSPLNVPAVVEIPLLPGESITGAEPRVRDGRALVSMGPQASEIAWESALKEAPALELLAAQDTGYIEVWRLNAGTQWHVVADGIAPVQHQERERWLPQWQPWPGERVTLRISKPQGVAGQTVTIDRSHLALRPGIRVTDAALSLTLRASRGGEQTLALPPEAVLQSVAIDGALQPIRLEGAELRLPLVPGTQNVDIRWQQPQGIAWRYAAPSVDLGIASVNAGTEIALPQDRWLLLVGGPAMGPAILFWGVLVVIVMLAFALGRMEGSPLKAWQWLLLGLGLTQDSIVVAALIAGWFFAFALRARIAQRLSEHDWWLDLVQIGLVVLTIAAGAGLYSAVSQGLLGTPDMQVAGNGSSHNQLIWYQDRAGRVLPTPWTVSVPILVYRLLMLAWALWLAYSLLAWVRWAWQAFSAGGLWRKLRFTLPRISRRSAEP
jgi:hypothetical protein